MIDWSIGHYEETAAELEPVAEHVVSLAGLRSGERAADAGVHASFVVGDLSALPFDDASFDVALSIFAVIFAADASRAFAEMIRVLKPSGRALLSVWVPAGPIDAMVGTFGRAMATATGSSPKRLLARRGGGWRHGRTSRRAGAGPRRAAEDHCRVPRGIFRRERAVTSNEHRGSRSSRTRRQLHQGAPSRSLKSGSVRRPRRARGVSSTGSPPPGAPTIGIRLISIMGGSEVARGRKPTKEERRRARKLRKAG